MYKGVTRVYHQQIRSSLPLAVLALRVVSATAPPSHSHLSQAHGMHQPLEFSPTQHQVCRHRHLPTPHCVSIASPPDAHRPLMLSAAPVEQSDASPSPGSTTPNAMGTHASSSPPLHSRHRFALPPPPRRGAGGGHVSGVSYAAPCRSMPDTAPHSSNGMAAAGAATSGVVTSAKTLSRPKMTSCAASSRALRSASSRS